MTQELLRRPNNKALVNTNVSEYQAAKARAAQTQHIKSLEKRINKLESTVEALSETIANCKRDD